MERKNERHTYISAGISREAFQASGCQLTLADDTLEYFIHAHDHSPYKDIECNEGCQVIRNGKVEFVTRSDVGADAR
jgi:hypothetical protein